MAIPSFDPESRFISKLSIIFISLAIFTFSIILLPYFFPEISFKTLGELGAFSNGIIMPIVGIAAALLTFLAFYIQYLANLEFQKQFKIQQFESQFYEMIRLHKENINEMKITGYDLTQRKIYNFGILTSVEKNETVRLTEGRKVFVTMITELSACILILIKYNKELGSPITEEKLNMLAYQFFFFGTKSESIHVDGIKLNIVKIFSKKLEEIKNQHRTSSGLKNRFGLGYDETIKLYIKYSPFSGHESRLGHYYRHLFNTVEYVVNQDIFVYEEKRKYLKLLRSQMSNDEHLLLYYNYLIGFGKEWGDQNYLTKYRMLKNLPIERVKYVENPRDHFKTFINSLKESGDEMFERGDY